MTKEIRFYKNSYEFLRSEIVDLMAIGEDVRSWLVINALLHPDSQLWAEVIVGEFTQRYVYNFENHSVEKGLAFNSYTLEKL